MEGQEGQQFYPFSTVKMGPYVRFGRQEVRGLSRVPSSRILLLWNLHTLGSHAKINQICSVSTVEFQRGWQLRLWRKKILSTCENVIQLERDPKPPLIISQPLWNKHINIVCCLVEASLCDFGNLIRNKLEVYVWLKLCRWWGKLHALSIRSCAYEKGSLTLVPYKWKLYLQLIA